MTNMVAIQKKVMSRVLSCPDVFEWEWECGDALDWETPNFAPRNNNCFLRNRHKTRFDYNLLWSCCWLVPSFSTDGGGVACDPEFWVDPLWLETVLLRVKLKKGRFFHLLSQIRLILLKKKFLPILFVIKQDSEIEEKHERERYYSCGYESEPDSVHFDVVFTLSDLWVNKCN